MVISLRIPEHVLSICKTLRNAGHEAYVVGGGIRDALLGREPKDWDVATDAAPDQVQQLFTKTVPTGIEFGTVTVLVDGKHAVEVTTFRGESGYADARRPDAVEFIGSIELDLVRRDFTVNAIAYDPAGDVIVDPHGGQKDLRAKLIRAVGDPDERFREDGLRVLRAVRIAVEIGFDIEHHTAEAIKRQGSRLLHISRERIGQEWRRLLAAPAAGRGLRVLSELELLGFVLPSSERTGTVVTNEAVMRTAAALHRAQDESFVVKTALVLTGLGHTDDDKHWLKQLVYPKHIARPVLHITRSLRAFDPEAVQDDASLRRFLHSLGRSHIDAFFSAWTAWQPTNRARLLKERASRIVDRGDALTASELAVNGRDVQATLPGARGPAVGAVLAQLLDHVIERPEDNTRERLTQLMKAWYRRSS